MNNMHPLCEMVPKKLLLPIRSLVAHKLYEKNLSQTEIAKMMRLSQVSVNTYLRMDPEMIYKEMKKIGVERNFLDTVIGGIIEDLNRNPYDSTVTFCLLCKKLRMDRTLCDVHLSIFPSMDSGCNVCDKLFTIEKVDSKRIEILMALNNLVREFINYTEFKNLVPENNLNIVYSLPEAISIDEVAGIPSKISVNRGEMKIYTNPEFGDDSRVSRLLLELNKNNLDFRVGINIKYNKKFIEIFERFKISHFNIKLINDIKNSKDLLVLVQEPSEEEFPNIYIFSKDPSSLIDFLKILVSEIHH